jgi:hypothetical protein
LTGKGTVDFAAIALDSFGNVLGNSLARAETNTNTGGLTQEQLANQQALFGDGSVPQQSPVAPFDPQQAFLEQEAIRSQAAENLTITVRPGDSLSEISERLFGDAFLFTDIAAANGITDPNFGIRAGQQLTIPNLNRLRGDQRQQLNAFGRSEISRLGNEALDAIANFDFSTLYNEDFTINDNAVRDLTNFHRRAALDADILFNRTEGVVNGVFITDTFSASLNGREVFRQEFNNSIGGDFPSLPGGLGVAERDTFVRQIVGQTGTTGTVTGSFGTAFGALGTTRSQRVGEQILSRAGNLNRDQRVRLERARSLDAASGIFSARSQTGQAIETIANSRVGSLSRSLPLIGHTLALGSIGVDAYLAPEGQRADAAQAAAFSVAAGYVVAGGAAAIGSLVVAPILGVSAVVAGATLGITAALGYDLGGFDDDAKAFYRNFLDELERGPNR